MLNSLEIFRQDSINMALLDAIMKEVLLIASTKVREELYLLQKLT